MTENDRLSFLREIIPHAKNMEIKTGIPYIAIISQAVLESGWGENRIGNNLFGIKYKSGDYKAVKVLTTEYSKKEDAYKEYISREKIGDKYKFKVYQDFADYKTLEDCLLAHSKLLTTERYKPALRWKHSPKRYLIAIWRLGYATDINYGYKILGGTYNGVKYYSFVNSVTSRLKNL